MSKIRETVERTSSQKKNENLYSGFVINARIISKQNSIRQTIIDAEKPSSADFVKTAKRKSSPNKAKIVTNNMRIVQDQ